MRATINAKTLRRIVMATKGFTCNAGSVRPVMEYIKLEFRKDGNAVTASATDGFRLSTEHAICGEIDEDFDAYIKPILPPIVSNSWAVISVCGDKCYIEIAGMISGFNQPKIGTNFDYQKTIDHLAEKPPVLRIGFNGEYLLSALQAAKASAGSSFKLPVVLEFRSPMEPMFITTNTGKDVKMVLPIRLVGEDLK